MPITWQRKAGVVLLKLDKPAPDHERAVHQALAIRIATLMGTRFFAEHEQHEGLKGPLYYLPNDTLVDSRICQKLGIGTEADLFGGIAPYPFVATKAISHPLFPGATAPPGWSTGFAENAGDALLAGYSVFNRDDAWRAAGAMLKDGPLRLKPVRATAGRGQLVVTDMRQIEAALAAMAPNELSTWGLVLEQQLEKVKTYSVGQIRVAGAMLSYYGQQRLTIDHHGEEVYGGSDLVLVRGDYAQLFNMSLDAPIRVAIEQACRFEHAAFSAYPGLIASRRNYDVAQGLDYTGQFRSGVLEQSWRAGGASSAEILALEAFMEQPALQRVCASTHEFFGQCEPPRDAILFYQGDDREVGRICKYARIQPYERAK